mmetsp:Transcript_38943/g.81468  ORF Transcript_38943/g.81468 Transcript_38943/m.81468 type:complete len:275 (+) Transcript_38943:86-910(+)
MPAIFQDTLMDLKALVEKEDADGYGVSRVRSSAQICNLWYGIVDRYGICRGSVPLAWNYFSRFISNVQSITPQRIELLVKASLFLAIKVHTTAEETRRVEHVRALSALADQTKVLDMEEEMLRVLEWRVNPPTMHHFADRLIKLHPLARCDLVSGNRIGELVRYQLERVLYFSELMMNYRPSIMAFAAIMRAEEELDSRLLTVNMREKFLSLQSKLKMDICEVDECMSALENSIPQLEDPEGPGNDVVPSASVPSPTGGDPCISPTSVTAAEGN